MNKKTIVFIIGIIFIFIIIVSKIVEYNIEEEVKNYLINDKHININNIAYLKAEIGKAPLLAVEVRFTDEPGMRYFYRREHGQIVQFNTAPPIGSDVNGNYTYKHKEHSDE
ncbi:DUF3139 domain-containing protein [Paenibacillus campi]|uniref:DUF3139 domain-containing protein n=1 Tax=Paenibacillus campi TaxID=3106031 RepID=UPI002AFFF05C|nr:MULTISPECIES: DUF3139 domain-containing protein [unclassified Paenibacillus]